MRAWKNILEGENKATRLEMIGDICDNNYELMKHIKIQIKLLQTYEDEFKDVMPIKDYIEGYKEMLDVLGLTVDAIDDEWDDETDRKS